MSEELKPCPFCNSSAMPGQVHAQCSNSVCPAFHIKTTPKRWNRRAQPAEQQDEALMIGTLHRDCDERIVFESSGEIHIKDGMEVFASPAAQAVKLPDVDRLSNIIRQVDGNHSLGAGALAEKILEAVAQLNGIEP